jgi:hypothetical protein
LFVEDVDGNEAALVLFFPSRQGFLGRAWKRVEMTVFLAVPVEKNRGGGLRELVENAKPMWVKSM